MQADKNTVIAGVSILQKAMAVFLLAKVHGEIKRNKKEATHQLRCGGFFERADSGNRTRLSSLGS